MRIEKKKKIAEDLRSCFNKSTSVFLTDYKGLNVESINLLRRRLRKVGVEFKVVKNSLLIRASTDNNIKIISSYFKGPSAVALSYNDASDAAKILVDFSSEVGTLDLKVGVVDEKIINVRDIKILASLPSKDILLGQLLFTMSATTTSFVNVLSAVCRGLINVLQGIKKNKEDES